MGHHDIFPLYNNVDLKNFLEHENMMILFVCFLCFKAYEVYYYYYPNTNGVIKVQLLHQITNKNLISSDSSRIYQYGL